MKQFILLLLLLLNYAITSNVSIISLGAKKYGGSKYTGKTSKYVLRYVGDTPQFRLTDRNGNNVIIDKETKSMKNGPYEGSEFYIRPVDDATYFIYYADQCIRYDPGVNNFVIKNPDEECNMEDDNDLFTIQFLGQIEDEKSRARNKSRKRDHYDNNRTGIRRKHRRPFAMNMRRNRSDKRSDDSDSSKSSCCWDSDERNNRRKGKRRSRRRSGNDRNNMRDYDDDYKKFASSKKRYDDDDISYCDIIEGNLEKDYDGKSRRKRSDTRNRRSDSKDSKLIDDCEDEKTIEKNFQILDSIANKCTDYDILCNNEDFKERLRKIETKLPLALIG